jgi:hypothetical protein
MMCKLLKSLYDLKQALKQWHKKFDRFLTSAGFVVNKVDKCVILCLYVDDIMIFGNNFNVSLCSTCAHQHNQETCCTRTHAMIILQIQPKPIIS